MELYGNMQIERDGALRSFEVTVPDDDKWHGFSCQENGEFKRLMISDRLIRMLCQRHCHKEEL